MTLVEFLTARYNEDERAIRDDDITLCRWQNDSEQYEPADAGEYQTAVLRDIEAKRKIVAMHSTCGWGIGYCDDGGHGWDNGGCGTLGFLTEPFSDHPDYNPEWRTNA